MPITIEPIGTPHFKDAQVRAMYRYLCKHPTASLHEIGNAIGVDTHGGTPPTLTRDFRLLMNSSYIEPGEDGPIIHGQDHVEDIVGFRVTDQ